MVDDSKQPQPSSSQQQHYTRKPSGNDDFARTIAKISVAQICDNQGFQGFHQSALDALSDVAVRYVKELGKASNLYANLSGRSECNVFDLIQGLEDLGLVQGFPGASDVHRSLAKSGVVRELGQYLNFVESVPFVFDVPGFPVCVECKLPSSFSQSGDAPPGDHIPAWLPAFPRILEPRDGSSTDVEVVREEQPEQQVVAKDRVDGNVNPFLAPPLRFGEKDVGLVEPPSRFYVRNDGGMSGHNGMPRELCAIDDEKIDCVKSDERPIVRLKFDNVMKSSLPSCDAKSYRKLASCFTIEVENDENSLRTEGL